MYCGGYRQSGGGDTGAFNWDGSKAAEGFDQVAFIEEPGAFHGACLPVVGLGPHSEEPEAMGK